MTSKLPFSSGFSPRGGDLFFSEIVPAGGKSTIPGGIFFFSPLPRGGVYHGGYVHKRKPWSIHTDSSSECAMDNVNEQPSGQQGGEGTSDKNDKRKERGSWGSLAPVAKK